MVRSDSAPVPERARLALTAPAVIVMCSVALAILGLTTLFSATISFQQGPFSYLAKQIVGMFLAVGAAWVTSRLNFDYLRSHVWVLAAITIILLVAVLIPGIGVEVKGSRRWLGLGPLRLQISEFAKIATVFCLAHYLALNQSRIESFKHGYVLPLLIIGAFAGFVFLQPDFGTTALIGAVGLILLFLAGARWRFILPTIALGGAFFTIAVMLNENRLRRFMGFLDLEENKLGSGYQLYQSLLAFAAGGFEGAGLGQGRQQMHFLPEAHTDFIFAVMGEELGLVATLGVVGLFTVILIAGLVHLRKAPNLFDYLLVAGCISIITLQAVINLGVVTGLLPTKGMSLPFLSAGLSNLLLMGILIGIILNTQRRWSNIRLGNDRQFGGSRR
ncbi:MAG: putative peptidoglycan glycosyltransferase FtsW [Verrucomicrobiota bacterium]